MKKLLIASLSVLVLTADAAFAGSPGVSSSDVDQEGSRSIASVEQIGGLTGSNTSVITQDDMTRASGVYMGTNSDGRALYTGAYIYQDASQGANNESYITQHSNSDGIFIEQSGSTSNISHITSAGDGSSIQVFQKGASGANDSLVLGQGGASNGIEILQEAAGGNNYSTIYGQGGVWTPYDGSTNLIRVKQYATADSNHSFVEQNGAHNTTDITQNALGGANWSWVEQGLDGALTGDSIVLEQTAVTGVTNSSVIHHNSAGGNNTVSLTQR